MLSPDGEGSHGVSAEGQSYLSLLNPKQREAVESLYGPVLVLAGAGTGKTLVLTTRIVHILSGRHAFPSQILAVTFTNKAAQEMRKRIERLIGDSVGAMPWLGTFHSIGAKILRKHGELVGLEGNFSILDKDDQLRLLKALISAHGIDEKRWPARTLSSCIDRWKNLGLTPDKVGTSEKDSFYADGQGQILYKAYQERLESINAVDFGDLLLSCLTLFNKNNDILEQYRDRFRFIMVDEYQDTNAAQYLWLRLFTRPGSNICCVGDEDQSIYAWRGAEIDNILLFDKHFPGAKIIRLECNYRSTSNILDAASHLIAYNRGRLGKKLYSADDEEGVKVHVCEHWSGSEEAQAIGQEIEYSQRQGEMLDDIAILVRASFQMRAFEDRFITIGLNYRVIGGPRFYERAEIRDALAYLKLLTTRNNDLAFERIINLPRRNIGNSTMNILHQVARANSFSLMEAARFCSQEGKLKPKTRLSLVHFLKKMDQWRSLLDEMPHPDLAGLVLEESGYTRMWQQDKSPDAQGRLENLKELVQSMESFENMIEFLEHVSLFMDTEQQGNKKEDKVNIMTLHAAKGLEFNTVFLPGWEEGLFPHQRSLDEPNGDGLEEERRLAYVGITRARRAVKISFARSRRIRNSWQSPDPSRFISELPEDKIFKEGNFGDYNHYKGIRFPEN
ncbi:MAG: UvrD-helicase domain-containing protein [Alphaproteobacteria bacterium]|nr:UvrD-helicase domain-containing protein [Alphaproteobacteria bacterium]